MNLFLLGCLCLHIAINPVWSSDLDISSIESKIQFNNFENCTECKIKTDTSCICLNKENGRCLICCSNIPQCCYCHNCSLCWDTQWKMIIITHLGISILFVLGIMAIIIIYLRTCYRTRRIVRTRCLLVEEHERTTHCSTVENLRERPPPYSETYDAPPLYTSPYNRASMQEAPPVYPGTPKPQEGARNVTDTSAPSVIQHM